MKQVAKAKKVTKSKSGVKSGTLVRQPHGGAIRVGSQKGNTPGTGRPPDEIRAKLREIGVSKGVPFLSDVLDGKITFTLTGVCSECGKESKPTDALWLRVLTDQITASVDQRLKANEQAFKYGLGTKDEISVTDHPKFREAVAVVRAELEAEFGADRVDAAIMRAQSKIQA